MPGKIQILDRSVAEKIAAGEVIERPASVVKELVENSIDAEASRIDVEIKDGGRKKIKVSDNGTGMSPTDASLAFERHSTSKIRSFEDLYRIVSMGFRGEALASISAVSKVNLVTKEKGAVFGTKILFEGGYFAGNEETGAPEGTTVTVEDIFFNVPARRKFLSSSISEQSAINKFLTRTSLAYPEIFFTFSNEKKQIFSYPPVDSFLLRTEQLYGNEVRGRILEFENESNELAVKGFISHPSLSFGNRNRMYVFVNRRFIKSNLIYKAVQDGYGNTISSGKFPLLILFINISPHLIDVNIHPTKEDIKFSNQSIIYPFIKKSVQTRLNQSDTPGIAFHKKTFEVTEKEVVRKNLPAGKVFSGFNPGISSGILKERKNFYSHNNNDNERNSNHLYSDHKTRETPFYNVENDIFSSLSGEDSILETFPKEETEKQVNKEFSSVPPVIGSFKNTYIIAASGTKLFLIDQHVAHERVNYELLKKNLAKKTFSPSQSLLFPETLEFPSHEAEWLRNRLSIFKDLGFDIEDFGDNTFLLRGVPLSLEKMKKSDIFCEIISECVISEKRLTSAGLMKNLMATVACKASVKAGDILSPEEMEKLLNELFSTEEPFYCPHGRPVIITFSEQDLGKLFKRV